MRIQFRPDNKSLSFPAAVSYFFSIVLSLLLGKNCFNILVHFPIRKRYGNKSCTKSVPDGNCANIINSGESVSGLTPQKDRVDIIAGERRGVAEAPRAGAQRPATPTA